MDTQLTIRQMKLTHWAEIISQCRTQCQSDGTEVRQWLKDNGINRAQYYYWHKKVRDAALAQTGGSGFMELRCPTPDSPTFPAGPGGAQLSISVGSFTISVPEGTGRDLLRMVLEEAVRVK